MKREDWQGVDEPDYLPDEWLIELGKIVKAWTTFERLFDLMLQKLAGYDDPFDPVFTILTAHSSFPQRMDMFKSLCARHAASNQHLADYKRVMSDVSEAQRLRNQFIHHLIGREADGTVKITTFSARGQLKTDLRTIELAEVSNAHRKIFSAGREIYALVMNSRPWNPEPIT